MLKLSTQKINQSILICGCGRSGTSIMGTLIASHKNVEYCFDPPLIHKLIYLTNNIAPQIWRELLETSLYSDYFIGQIAGRNLNFNKYDLSYILNYKEENEINERLSNKAKRSEIEKKAQGHTLCFKVTDALLQIKFFKSLYPDINIIVMFRNAYDTIYSIVNQRWFSDETISKINIDKTQPMKIYKGIHVPLWVKEEEKDIWIASNEIERAAMYYIALNSILLKNMDLAITINYDLFIKNPFEAAKELGKILNIEQGQKTENIIKSIKPLSKHPADLIKKCRNSLCEQAKNLSDQISLFL